MGAGPLYAVSAASQHFSGVRFPSFVGFLRCRVLLEERGVQGREAKPGPVARNHRSAVPVVGKLTSTTLGEHLEAIGRRVVNRDHGQQFRAQDVQTAHPALAEGIERYLTSGTIRSIGPQPDAVAPSVPIRPSRCPQSHASTAMLSAR